MMAGVLPIHLSHLPPPAPDAIAHSERLRASIAQEIAAGDGWISFARYMELALHAPGLGYYSAGAHKLGAAGDFITAPESGALFARTLARQMEQCLRAGLPAILEVGAGSGRLACDVLTELARLDCLPRRYLILETSADLRERQRALLQRELPHFIDRVNWLSALPASLSALVIANEVLDAMPAHLVTIRDGIPSEVGITVKNDTFAWNTRPAAGELLAVARELNLAPGYTTEIHLPALAFIRSLAGQLAHGVVLLVDYGFPAREYYHPQRTRGTLMCHYRHHAHDDPLCLTGLQDITTHLDFSAIARVATGSGLDLLGYTNQAQFLINCGILDVLAATSPGNAAAYLPLAAQAQRLMSPAEMGELFKVMAIGKNFPGVLRGFARGDKRDTL
jgi:SAM-dependent MidA family methyltransferase